MIDSAEDIKSRLSWRDRLEPFHHQVQNLFTFCRRLPVTLIADDVGLGKTISAGLVLAELLARRRIRRALVICPKILAPQWVEELDGKFGIAAKDALGTDLNKEFRRQTPVVVTTYESARDRLHLLQPDSFGMLVLDEAHKLRNLYGTQIPPKIAMQLRKALEQRLFKYVLMLTATPIQNRLWDIYSLLDCLTVAKGHKNPLGTSQEFQDTYIARGTADRGVKPEHAEQLRGILRQYLVRTRRGDAALLFPQREVRLARVKPTEAEKMLHRLVAARIADLSPLLQTSLAQALMSSPQALAAQMENMVKTGKFAPQEAAEARQIADRVGLTGKLQGLLALARDLERERPTDWRMVVFTIRKETQQAIGKVLSEKGISYGYIRGGNAKQNQEAINGFRRDPPDIHVIVSTDAGAEGINLQVANVIVNYDLPWNPMIVEQRIGRLQRLASKHAHVVVWNLVVAGSVEERVVARLMEKLQLISRAIGDIEAILESVGSDGEGEEGNSFESQIRELVVKALVGQDVDKDMQLKQQSIERAQKALEEQREELEQTLGRLNALHRVGPTMPKLTRVSPSVPARDFVIRAKRAEGAQVSHLSECLSEAQVPGKPRELLAFDEAAAQADGSSAVFMGNSPKLYLPGKPHFERLAQHWVDNAGHRIVDLRPQGLPYVEELGREWCDTLAGAEFKRAEWKPMSCSFQGSFVLRTKAGNAVDSYEKLIPANCIPKGHTRIGLTGEADGLVQGEVLPSKIFPTLKNQVARVVEADKDVGEFCRFYQTRLEEEQSKAERDERKLHKIETDFRPTVFAEVAAIQGALYELGVVTVYFVLDGEHDYAVELQAIPMARQILQEPPREACAVTGRTVPAPCLGVSIVSGKRVLRHFLAVCEITGVELLREELIRSDVSRKMFRADQKTVSASGMIGHCSEFVTCAITGDRILPHEAGESQMSGRRVRKELLRCSERAPGRIGARDEIVVCAESGRCLLIDEVAKSAVSGKLCDRELLLPSARSGRLALNRELVQCEVSKALLLPDEVGRCCLTGKIVDSRLLSASELSGAQALRELFVPCSKTGKRVFPQELEACELTGQKVIPTELETCFITGRRALRDRLFRSAVSGFYLLPNLAVRSAISRKICARSEAVRCQWLEQLVLPDEVGTCRLTGLTIAKEFLNSQSELTCLRQLLDGSTTGSEAPELIPWLREQRPDVFGKLQRAWSVISPSGGVRALCGEVRSLFGLKVRCAGLVICDREKREMMGRGSIGQRRKNTWFSEQNF